MSKYNPKTLQTKDGRTEVRVLEEVADRADGEHQVHHRADTPDLAKVASTVRRDPVTVVLGKGLAMSIVSLRQKKK